jgi:hypothetical protein
VPFLLISPRLRPDPWANGFSQVGNRLRRVDNWLSFPATAGAALANTPSFRNGCRTGGTQRRLLWHTPTEAESSWVVCSLVW